PSETGKVLVGRNAAHTGIMPVQHLFRALIQYRRPRAIRERADHCALHCIVGRDDDPLPVGWMCVEERREMRNHLRRSHFVLDFVEPNVITGWFVGRLHCFASACRPVSVILTRATSMVRPLAQTRSDRQAIRYSFWYFW